MKRIALLLVLAATACGGSGGGGGGPANFAATWTISVAGTPVDCAALTSETVTLDFTRVRTGDVDQFRFDCTQGLGHLITPATPSLVQDTYDLTITLWNNFDGGAASRVNLASTTITVVLVGGISQLPTFAFTPSFGRFDLAWTIDNPGGADTCAAVGADTFEWTITNTANSNVDTFLYTCSDMAALTDNPPVPFGTYNVRARLLSGSTELGMASRSNLIVDRLTVTVPLFLFAF